MAKVIKDKNSLFYYIKDLIENDKKRREGSVYLKPILFNSTKIIFTINRVNQIKW